MTCCCHNHHAQLCTKKQATTKSVLAVSASFYEVEYCHWNSKSTPEMQKRGSTQNMVQIFVTDLKKRCNQGAIEISLEDVQVPSNYSLSFHRPHPSLIKIVHLDEHITPSPVIPRYWKISQYPILTNLIPLCFF